MRDCRDYISLYIDGRLLETISGRPLLIVKPLPIFRAREALPLGRGVRGHGHRTRRGRLRQPRPAPAAEGNIPI